MSPTIVSMVTFGNRAHEFTWPIWTQWAGVDTVRSLLGLSELKKPRRRNLWVTDTVEWCRETRARVPAAGW